MRVDKPDFCQSLDLYIINLENPDRSHSMLIWFAYGKVRDYRRKFKDLFCTL